MGWIKNIVANKILNLVSGNKYLFEKLLTSNRSRLVSESITYPSIINNGLLHIEQVLELADYLKLKDRAGIVVDVGAADGSISILLEEHFKNSKVYSFEPIKETYNTLVQSVSGHKRIYSFNKALGAKSQTLTINKSNRITSSSLFPIEEKIKDGFFAESLQKVGEEIIEGSTMDNEIPKDVPVNLIKIDVQGYELEVLQGAQQTLANTAVIILEVQNHNMYINAPKYYELDSYLREKNFVLYNIVPSLRKNKKLYEWDSIYVNKELDIKINN